MGLRRPVVLVALLLLFASAGIYTPITIPKYTKPHTAPIHLCGTSCGTTDWFASTPFYRGAVPFVIGKDSDGYDIVAAGHDAADKVRIPGDGQTILKKARRIHFLLTGAHSDCEQKMTLRLQYEGGTSADVELEVPDKGFGCENIAIYFGQALDWFIYARSVQNPEPDKNIVALELLNELEGFGPQIILIAITFEYGEADDDKDSCDAMVGKDHWAVGAGERQAAYIYLYYGNSGAESISNLTKVSEGVLVNPGFETTDACLEDDPEGWIQYAAGASNDCWEVETSRVKSGSKAFGNSFGCDEVCNDDEGAAGVWPNIYVRQDIALPAKGQYRVKAGYWFTGDTFDGSACANYALGEDDSRPHLFALDSGGGQLDEHKGPSFSDLGKVLTMGTWAYQDIEWTTPKNTKSVRLQVDALDGNDACQSSDTYNGGNAGGYVDDALVFVRKLPGEEPLVVLGGADAAAWWHADWEQRLAIGIVSDEALEDSQVKVILDTAAIIKADLMNEDCSDIRFTTDDGTLLPHWIEKGCNSVKTLVWVRVPTVPEADYIDATCCGDDGGEHRVARQCQSGCVSDPDEIACCDDPNDCVFDECVLYTSEGKCKADDCTWNSGRTPPCYGKSRCYGIADERDLMGDGTREYCEWGVWKERFEVMYEAGVINEPRHVVQHITRGGGSIYLKVRNQLGSGKKITNMNFSVTGMLQDMNPTFFTSEGDRVWNERTNTLRKFPDLASITVTLRYDIPSFNDLLVNQFKGGLVIVADDLPPVYLPVTIYVNYTNVRIDDLNRKDIHALMSFSMGSIKVSGGYRTDE
ncbi:MAG: DUF2341 domain-containing protein [Candidatus Undinarchaeales archaeon]|nr:DUF2341 domain-containing protein [Candidatus Undinarchaeales archaeon]